MGNTAPSQAIKSKQKVRIKGFSFSQEHVPKEIKRYGELAIAVQTTKLEKSRNESPNVYVTRVYFPKDKHYETFFTKDLIPID
jgi:hypothetical protein